MKFGLKNRTATPECSSFSHCSAPVSRPLSMVSYLLSTVFCLPSPFSRLLFPVSRFLSHVSCLTSPVSHVLFHVFCLMHSFSLILSHVSAYFSRLMSQVSCPGCPKSPVSSLTYHVSCLGLMFYDGVFQAFQTQNL